MKLFKYRCFALGTILGSTVVPAVSAEQQYVSEEVLFFDQPSRAIEYTEFDQQDPLSPLSNDFKIIELSYLSNRQGERWALITFKNTSSGQRLIKNENVVATFADGTQVNAKNLDERFVGGEMLTRSIFFGRHQFPIVNVAVE